MMRTTRDTYDSFVQKEIQNARQAQKVKLLESYVENCSPEGELDEDNFKMLVRSIHDSVSDFNKNAALSIRELFKNKTMSADDKINNIIDIALRSGAYDESSSIYQFHQIIARENELNEFLADPAKFIRNKNLSLSQTQVLQDTYNDEHFKRFCQETRGKALSGFKSALSKLMESLNLNDYASRDAIRFKSCINPDVEEFVRKKAQKPDYSGVQVIGFAGVQQGSTYTRKYIENTAKNVKKAKAGECHTFAQLAAQYLLSEMEVGRIKAENIKIVSHPDKLGSHTFVLLGHNSDDLSDLSNCTLIDPWAAAMGYTKTNGIFNIDNYPYPSMVTNLISVYESKNDPVHQEALGHPVKTTVAREQTETKPSVAAVSVFSDPEAQRKADTQKFIGSLLNAFVKMGNTTSNEYSLLYYLKNSFEAGELSPKEALLKSVDVFFNLTVDRKPNNSFTWENQSIAEPLINSSKHKQTIVDTFNPDSVVKTFFIRYLKNEGVIDKDAKVDKLSGDHIIKLAETISQDDSIKREFKGPAPTPKSAR